MPASHDDDAHVARLPALAGQRARHWPASHTNTTATAAATQADDGRGCGCTHGRRRRCARADSGQPYDHGSVAPAGHGTRSPGWGMARGKGTQPGWTRSVAGHLVCRDGPRRRSTTGRRKCASTVAGQGHARARGWGPGTRRRFRQTWADGSAVALARPTAHGDDGAAAQRWRGTAGGRRGCSIGGAGGAAEEGSASRGSRRNSSRRSSGAAAAAADSGQRAAGRAS
jgi:hypothetical protein